MNSLVKEQLESTEKRLIEEIEFLDKKLEEIAKNKNNLDIKQMSDLHRYAETRLFAINSLICVYSILGK